MVYRIQHKNWPYHRRQVDGRVKRPRTLEDYCYYVDSTHQASDYEI